MIRHNSPLKKFKNPEEYRLRKKRKKTSQEFRLKRRKKKRSREYVPHAPSARGPRDAGHPRGHGKPRHP